MSEAKEGASLGVGATAESKPPAKVRCAACGRPIGRRRRRVFLHSPEPLEPEVFGPFHRACMKRLRDETFPGWDITDLETGEVMK